MQEMTFFNALLVFFFVLAAVVFVALFFVAAPYGRHSRQGWGYAVGSRLGWVLMEAPSPLIFGACFLLAGGAGITGVIFLLMWEGHYIHRAFIYPFSLNSAARRMPLSVVSFAIIFNLMNAYLNGCYVFTFSGGYSAEWLADPRFIIGVVLFVAGYFINRQSDLQLRRLRDGSESGYAVCNRGLFRRISCPNYFGEIIIWMGWAVATWSLPGLAFAVWTLANLLPRAHANHKWYRDNFPDYPPERKALVPGFW